jgi:hypothetical protein
MSALWLFVEDSTTACNAFDGTEQYERATLFLIALRYLAFGPALCNADRG